MILRFFVPGRPQTAGSKRAFPYKKKDGKLGVAVSDDNPRTKGWQARLAAECAIAGIPLLQGELYLQVTFLLARPKGHYGTRGLKASAPHQPGTRPDATKLLRAVEDALTGILWHDDAQIVEQRVRKLYADGLREGVEILVAPTEEVDWWLVSTFDYPTGKEPHEGTPYVADLGPRAELDFNFSARGHRPGDPGRRRDG